MLERTRRTKHSSEDPAVRKLRCLRSSTVDCVITAKARLLWRENLRENYSFILYVMIYRKYTVNITVPVNSSTSKGIDGVSDEDSQEDIARSHAKVIAKAS